METLGQRIQQYRKEQGMSQEQLAERLEVSRQAISKWERDETLPELDKLIRMTEIFQVSADNLLHGKTNNKVIDTEKTKGTKKWYLVIVTILLFLSGIALGYCWKELTGKIVPAEEAQVSIPDMTIKEVLFSFPYQDDLSLRIIPLTYHKDVTAKIMVYYSDTKSTKYYDATWNGAAYDAEFQLYQSKNDILISLCYYEGDTQLVSLALLSVRQRAGDYEIITLY